MTRSELPCAEPQNQSVTRITAGKRSHALGAMFESWILRGCDWYWDKGIAYIEKTPEPMRPIKAFGDRKKGQFVAVYTKQAQPDFKGALCDGSTIVFDAKYTDSDTLRQSAVTDEQREEFNRYEKMGARCYIVAAMGPEDLYRIPWDDWKAGPEKLGRKHFKRSDLEAYRIHRRGSAVLFLEGIVL